MTDQIAEALRDVLQSPNVIDSNFESANRETRVGL